MIRFLIAHAMLAMLVTGAEKPTKAVARAGVKTPGVQIPFASLVGEADLAAGSAPEWVAFAAGSFYAPNGDAILKWTQKQTSRAIRLRA